MGLDKDGLLAALRASQFAEHVDLLEPLIRPSLRMATFKTKLAELPLGMSRMGGAPDLPAAMAWPRIGERPLDFLCQLDLAEVQVQGPFDELPRGGWLAFFCDSIEQPWGYDPAHAGGWCVLHFEAGPGGLVRRERPASDADERVEHYVPCALVMTPEACLPDVFDLIMPDIIESDDSFEEYIGFLESTGTTTEPFPDNNRLLGHPALVQGDMRETCQLASNGIDWGCSTIWYERSTTNTKALLAGAKHWQLLLQLDTNDSAPPGWQWGLGGRLYFWIKQQDLEAGNFDKAWIALQT